MKLEKDTTISHYKILSKIGKGGMGEVYLAEDTKLDRQVALKILPTEFAEDKDRMSRFVREAKSASALNHPNIITIHEIGESDGTNYIATEFIDGKTLSEYVTDNSLNYKSALDVAIQVASALDEAHQAGIVHRDIKPDNVMIRENGLVKILDFGIAKLTEKQDLDIESEDATAIQSGTMPGMVIGTANYMSPEQAKGKEVDARSDIFSFGVVLYEMMAGKLPFAGESAMDMIGAILHKEPLPLEKDVPIEIGKIVNKCLIKDRNERYQTIKSVLADLKHWQLKQLIENELQSTSTSHKRPDAETQIFKVATDENVQTIRITENSLTNSIAVMPFTNMSADEENEYFCDGLAEELLNALTKIEELKVAARTSAFSFKGKDANISEIGGKLSVKNVLEGSVRKSGNKLRITVQLINASDGYQLWSERYDREMEDIFDIQDEIALAVVDALKLKLFGDEKESVTKRYTNNATAYQLYLKGRYHFARRTMDDMQKGLSYFEQALEVDPEYALAYVGIADVYNSWTKSLLKPAVEVIPKAKSAAKRALEIDPSLAEAHASLADSLAIFDWNWEEAGKEFKRAIELNAKVSFIHFTYGIGYLVPMGRMDEAIAELKRAVELEPLSLIANSILSEVYLYARQYDKALEQAQKAYDLNPNFVTSRFWLGFAMLAGGMTEEAIELSESSLQMMPSFPVYMYLAGQSYAKANRRPDAERIIEQIREISKTKYVQPYSIARIYASLGDNDKAFAELENAFEQKDWWLPRLRVDPMMDSLHNDSRFNEMLQKIGLPPLEPKTAILSEPGAIATGSNDDDEPATAIQSEPRAIATGSNDDDEPATAILSEPGAIATGFRGSEDQTRPKIFRTGAEAEPQDDLSDSTERPSLSAHRAAQPRRFDKRLLAIPFLIVVIVIGGFLGYRYFYSGSKQIESIAVMPFVNESGNEDVEYLSDGMTETLISSLSNLPNLNVKPRSSVFRYKGKKTDPQTIAKELNVQAILNGRVVQRGEDISLFVELTDISLDKVIWSETYNRKQTDLVKLQSEIAKDVSTKLKSKLSEAEEEKVTKTYTTNPEAYQAYLKGRYYWNRRTTDNLKKAIEEFKIATDKDPNYALAYVGLADCYGLLSGYSGVPTSETLPQAKAFAEKALSIDSTLAEPHATLGSINKNLWQWDESEKEYKRAIELNPNYATTYQWYSLLLVVLGRYDEAEMMIKQANRLDPLSSIIAVNISRIYQLQDNHEASIKNSLKILELDPNFAVAYHLLGLSYLKLGRNAEAVSAAEKAVQLTNRSPIGLNYLGYVYAAAGKRAEAIAIIKELEIKYSKNEASGYHLAAIYAGLGDKDKAFEWLEKDFQSRAGILYIIRYEIPYESLRDDPRYKDLLKRMNLPE